MYVPFISKIILGVVGIKLDLPKEIALSKKALFITFNHNSYFDIFALTALGLPNTRFMLSEKTIKIIPLTLAALAIDVLYIPQKKHPVRRMQFFRKISEMGLTIPYHIAASSEGVHDHHHGIDKFNRGVYLMATLCKMNILPLFIYVPEESNPFNKYKYFKRGTVKIEVMPVITTQHWELTDLDANKEAVRALFVQKFNEYNKTTIQ